LKEQEAAFKTTCKTEMDTLTEKIEAIQGDGVEIISDERVLAISNQLSADQGKLAKLQLLSVGDP
jgi:hypothetical protein